MEHVIIPIPDGLDETQKSQLTLWLTDRAAEATPVSLPFANDPDWQAEAARRIKRGLEDVKAGRVFDSQEARRRIADRCKGATSE